MPTITITTKRTEKGNMVYVVDAPFRASAAHAWRQVIGRWFNGTRNVVPVQYKKSLEACLRDEYADCDVVWVDADGDKRAADRQAAIEAGYGGILDLIGL